MPAGLSADHPRTDHGRLARDGRELRAALVDESFVAVRPRLVGDDRAVAAEDGDVGPLASQPRLAHERIPGERGSLGEGRQQVRMAGEQLPQHDQQLLVAEQQLPHRLDPLRGPAALQQEAAELLVDHPLPRVELEDVAHRFAVAVEEARGVDIPLQVLDVDQLGVEPGRLRRLGHVGDGLEVFDDELPVARVVQGREVQPGTGSEAPAGAADVLPLLHELLVERVELVRPVAADLGEPLPLRHRRLHEGGGSVGVELEQLHRPRAVVGEIEAAVHGRVVLVPRRLHEVVEPRRDAELGEAPLADDVLHRIHAPVEELLRGRLDEFDLRHREGVGRRLVPVRSAALGRQVVEGEPDLVEARAPARSGRGTFAPHPSPLTADPRRSYRSTA